MKIKKALGIVSLSVILLALGFMVPWGNSRAYANAYTTTDICTAFSVSTNTTFNATAPASVTPGQAFTVSGINSTPDNTYGQVVTSSTLGLSVTGAKPTTYSSTDPNPTANSPTYTSYYSNWALTATGAAGSKIVIKLVQATAVVTNIGTVTCPLTATLVTINITAPASSGGGSSGGASSTTGSSTPSKSTTTTPQTTTTSPTTTTPQTTTTTPKATDSASAQTVAMNILVVDSQKHPIKATVTLDGQLTVKTGTNGLASFTGIRKGEHTASVVFGRQKISKQVQAGTGNVLGATVVVPSSPSALLYGFIGLGVVLLVGVVGLVIKLFVAKKHQPNLALAAEPLASVQPAIVPQVQPTIIQPAPPTQPETPPATTLPQQ
jgi:hypothetical protein